MSHKTPPHLELLRGRPGKRALRRGLELPPLEEMPEPPPFLSEPARSAWFELGPELARANLLAELDVNLFGAYCVAYGRWRCAEEALTRIKPGDREAAALGRVAQAACRAMVELGGRFGMSPLARSKMGSGAGSPAREKFDGLLK
jgi:P27 family predicted phage terminase small subunit